MQFMNTIIDRLKDDLAEYKCLPFWSWNDKLDREELKRQIEWMSANGVGGFFMHARGGLKTEYLSEEWMQCVEACAEKAQELHMNAWIYDENGWPSGFVGGKLLENIKNRDRYLTHTVGAYDSASLVSYRIDGDRLVRKADGAEDGEYLNVFEHLSASTVDILNPEVVDQFLALTHEQYKKRFGEAFPQKIQGFFTDEPQYYRWDTPYSPMIRRYFREVYREDILDGLGLLFLEQAGYRKFRYRYWSGMQQLMLTNYAEKVYGWCCKNGVKLTGHYVEENSLGYQLMCCGGVMPFYEYEHIPGIDWLGRNGCNEIPARQLGSAARQLGKKQAISEMFACCGWDVTPRELKRIAEFQYVFGVNLMCQHLLPYAEHGQRKRDYPVHFSGANPWIREEFGVFNDYFTRLGCLLANSEEIVNVAMLHPIRSAYFDYKRTREQDAFNIRELDDSFFRQQKMLTKANVAFHFLDETLLAKHGFVDGNRIGCGKCSYEYLILPTCYTMDETTEKLLQQYVKNGGKVLLLDRKPAYLAGEEYSYEYLESNVTLEEIIQAQPYTVNDRNTELCSTLRKGVDGLFLFMQNASDTKAYTADIRLKNGYRSFEKLDLLTLTTEQVSTQMTLAPTESAVLFLSKEEIIGKPSVKAPVTPAAKWRVVRSTDNMLPVDYAFASRDGEHYGERLSCMGIFQQLLTERYEGDLYLKYPFRVGVLPKRISLLTEDNNTQSVTVNGRPVAWNSAADTEMQMHAADIAPYVRLGDNEIVVKIRYFQSEKVYYALFGENVTESLRNCLVYDTDVEPVILAGDFGVTAENGFTRGGAPNIWLADRFVIGGKKEEISELITDGYPFFAGTVTLKQTLSLSSANVILHVPGRFQAAAVRVNGSFAGKLLFENKLDISRFAHIGDNDLEIGVTTSNRNLLGPHHFGQEEEPMSVCPWIFELNGCWNNGKSNLHLDRYAFVSLNGREK